MGKKSSLYRTLVILSLQLFLDTGVGALKQFTENCSGSFVPGETEHLQSNGSIGGEELTEVCDYYKDLSCQNRVCRPNCPTQTTYDFEKQRCVYSLTYSSYNSLYTSYPCSKCTENAKCIDVLVRNYDYESYSPLATSNRTHCICVNSTILHEKKCVSRRRIGESCSTDEQCIKEDQESSASVPGRLYCIFNKCQCPFDSYTNSTYDRVLKKCIVYPQQKCRFGNRYVYSYDDAKLAYCVGNSRCLAQYGYGDLK